MKRVVIPELLDTDSGTAEEVRDSLADLRQINRWFGGTSTTTALLRRVGGASGKTQLSVLDIGAGLGEASIVATKAVGAHVTLLDRTASHLPRNGVPTVAGDAMALPFSDGAFDVVTSSLFMHHLEEEQIVECVNEALRVSRIGVVVNDLERSAVHLALVYAGLPFFRNRLTQHDGIASVKRAYTANEMRDILARTKAARIEMSTHYLYRLGAIAWKIST